MHVNQYGGEKSDWREIKNNALTAMHSSVRYDRAGTCKLVADVGLQRTVVGPMLLADETQYQSTSCSCYCLLADTVDLYVSHSHTSAVIRTSLLRGT